MTYNVFGGTLSLTQSVNQAFWTDGIGSEIFTELFAVFRIVQSVSASD